MDLSLQLPGRHERGLLLYQDIQYSTRWGFSIEARLVFFDTESYDSRVYEYENDLRGAFANPALYGKGRRWYLLVRSPPLLEVVTFSCKYSATQKDGVGTLSSGDSEIVGDLDDRFGIQLDMRW